MFFFSCIGKKKEAEDARCCLHRESDQNKIGLGLFKVLCDNKKKCRSPI